jgi:ribonuclease VapC
MAEIVMDASALLALLNAEPGADVVAEALPGAVISAVNISEVVAKLSGTGMMEKVIHQVIDPLGLEIVPFDGEQAYRAGALRAATREAGISPGDRACLSLGKMLDREVLTADRSWTKFSMGVKVRTIR